MYEMTNNSKYFKFKPLRQTPEANIVISHHTEHIIIRIWSMKLLHQSHSHHHQHSLEFLLAFLCHARSSISSSTYLHFRAKWERKSGLLDIQTHFAPTGKRGQKVNITNHVAALPCYLLGARDAAATVEKLKQVSKWQRQVGTVFRKIIWPTPAAENGCQTLVRRHHHQSAIIVLRAGRHIWRHKLGRKSLIYRKKILFFFGKRFVNLFIVFWLQNKIINSKLQIFLNVSK